MSQKLVIVRASDNRIGAPCELWIEKARFFGWNVCCHEIESKEKPTRMFCVTKNEAAFWFYNILEKFDFRNEVLTE